MLFWGGRPLHATLKLMCLSRIKYFLIDSDPGFPNPMNPRKSKTILSGWFNFYLLYVEFYCNKSLNNSLR